MIPGGDYLFKLYIKITLFTFVLGLNLSPTLSWADATPTASVTADSVSVDDFDSICQSILSNAGSANTSITAQKLQYCQAAQADQTAASAQGKTWKIWAAVAGVCGAMCVSSFAGVGNPYVCALSNAGAGVADAVITKNFTTALMAIGTSGASLLIEGQIRGGQTPPNPASIAPGQSAPEEKAPAKKDYGACLAAALAAYQAYTAHNGQTASEAQEKTDLASAASVDSSASTTTSQSTVATALAAASADTSSLAGATVSTAGTTVSSNGTNATTANSACLTSNTAQNVGFSISCAQATNQNIPNYVATPQFANDFQKSSGTSLGDFVSNSNLSSPGSAISAAMGGALSSSQATKLAAAIRDLDQQIPQDLVSSAYTSGGGGGGNSGGNSSEPDFASLLQGVTSQLLPKGQNQNNSNGLYLVVFANKNRAPDAIPEDKTLNIFDRITYRYYFVQKRFAEGGK